MINTLYKTLTISFLSISIFMQNEGEKMDKFLEHFAKRHR